MRRRLGFVAAVGICWILLIAGRLYHLQVLRYEHYAGKAGRQQLRVITLDPPRGTIYDARGRELAVSIQVDSVYAVPPEIGDPAAIAATLARVIPGLDRAKLARQLASEDREFVWVARKLDPPVADQVRALGIEGLYFLPETKRYYPMRELAAQVLGYVGTDNHGLAGLELVYDREITGKPGKRTVLRDARQGTVASPYLFSSEPEPGHDLYLTLDATVQHIAERELAKAIEERHAKRGSAIFLDPTTGGVLAMASYPPFDPNDFGNYPAESWRNRAVADVYEPGSTFKIITAAAGLEAGVVREDEPIDCQMGGINLWKGIRVRDHKPYGVLTFAQVIAKSSNVGVIKVAQRIKDERFYRTLRDFGFGQQTGIDLPGESAGILHPVERWGPITKAYIAFGQGVSVTPIQLASAAGAVANGGTLLKPHVVAAVSRGEARVPKYPTPPVVARPFSPETALRLTRLMEEVVTEGTGKSAEVKGYRVAGKTGTAQIAVRGGYRGYLPSFLGFAPADRPALVGLVAIAEPQGGEYYGAQVAAPAFGAIARQVLLYRGIHPERDRPAIWPGQVMMASLPGGVAPPPKVDAEETGDGDEQDGEAGAEPALWQGSPIPPGGPPPASPLERQLPRATPLHPREVALMRLSELVRGLPAVGDMGSDPEVRGVEHDSRQVRPGDLFLALPGQRFDGRRFAASAAASGAVAVIGPEPEGADPGVPWLVTEDPRALLGPLAARAYGHPDRELILAGVTGTNGKSTVATLTAAILSAAGRPAGFIGTLGYRFGAKTYEGGHTTPEASDLFRILREMRGDGAAAVAMEVSSHALAMGRVDGALFDAAVFTNLTRDHLDYHRDMEDYFAAKRTLFDRLKPGRRPAVNVDDPYGLRLAAEIPDALTFGERGEVSARQVELTTAGIRGILTTPSGEVPFASSILGRYNLSNLLAAAATAETLGLPHAAIAEAFAAQRPVPGRMEPVDRGQPFAVYIDYAHTDAALDAALRSARELQGVSRVAVVFGCGGDRDAGKRPIMGKVAGERADRVIATSDNPRSEDPLAILAGIEEGLKASGNASYRLIPDRREAIRTAIREAEPGWAVLVAGKGHESTQTIGNQKLPFSDLEEIGKALEERLG